MKSDDYTAEAICQCMGLTSFERDPACTGAREAIRLLLKPSFHPEICITFADGMVSVVRARAMIWRQFEPSPMLADRAEGTVLETAFASLLASMAPVPTSPDAVPGVMIDGMPAELLHFRAGVLALKVGGNGGRKGNFSAFLAVAIAMAWESISNPFCRNALAEAAEYVDKRLPREPEPTRKPIVETVVLGTEEDRTQLIEALRKQHGGC